MAVRLAVPVVPIFIEGLYDIYSVHDSWPKSGPVRVALGRPIQFRSDTGYTDAARQLEDAVRDLSRRGHLPTELKKSD
jgi:hypothetical protein